MKKKVWMNQGKENWRKMKKQAGAELGQAQPQLGLEVRIWG